MPRARPNEGGRTPAPVPQSYAPVPTQPSQPSGPAAGWYRDPGGVHQYRFWNGSRWTPGVANGPSARMRSRATSAKHTPNNTLTSATTGTARS